MGRWGQPSTPATGSALVEQADRHGELVTAQEALGAVDGVDDPGERIGAAAVVDPAEDLVQGHPTAQGPAHQAHDLLRPGLAGVLGEVRRPLLGDHPVAGEGGGHGREDHRLRPVVGHSDRFLAEFGHGFGSVGSLGEHAEAHGGSGPGGAPGDGEQIRERRVHREADCSEGRETPDVAPSPYPTVPAPARLLPA